MNHENTFWGCFGTVLGAIITGIFALIIAGKLSFFNSTVLLPEAQPMPNVQSTLQLTALTPNSTIQIITKTIPVQVIANSITVYKNPQKISLPLGILGFGANVTAIGTDASRNWILIEGQGWRGWVLREDVGIIEKNVTFDDLPKTGADDW